MTDLLLTTELAPEQRALLQTLTRSANTLLDLLNDILDFAKIEAGRVDLESIDFSPGQLARDIAAVMGPLASEKGNTIEVQIDPSLRAAYSGDAKRYRQILINLTGNANKFTANGRITISLRETDGDGGNLGIETLVADTGIGIAAGNREQLFQPFIQEDISTSRKFGGTGLGLAISKNLAELMGGRIWVESERGKGSTFGFVVMVQPGDASKIEAVADTAQRTTTAVNHLPIPRRPLRILLAEDNDTNRMLLTALLSRMGHNIASVENGALAVEEAARGSYDLILMDMQMPVMDGPAAMREIRRGLTAASRVPMIALTADAMREHHASYREAGAGAVVTKPVDWHRLNAEMDRLTAGSAGPVVADAPAGTADELAVLDGAMLESLSASIGGKLFNTLLDTCAANIRVYTAAIIAGADDLKEAKRLAHALKGLAAQFGALRLSELARQIEEGAKENREVGALAPLVAAAADDALEAFAGWREQQRVSA